MTDGADRRYQHSELSKSIRRNMKSKEKCLGRKCRTVWSFTNPKGEQYLFGFFVIDRTDKVIVTLGYWSKHIHKFIPCY